jgi:hypothetical protein
MRRLPNDTFTVSTSGDYESNSGYGDAMSSSEAWGGNDKITANVNGFDSFISLVGEDNTLSGNSRGGNDTLIANDLGWQAHTYAWGDASVAMYESSHGGDDNLLAANSGLQSWSALAAAV